MSIHVFDPRNVRTEEYRSKYPELHKIPEFADLPVRELIFVWWMSNPTSPLVKKLKDTKQRVLAALQESGYNPGKDATERMMNGVFSENVAVAMDRMSKVDASTRNRARTMVENIMKNYEEIINNKESVKSLEKDEQKKYVDLTAKITDALPMLIEKLEIGFGVTQRGGKDDGTEGTSVATFEKEFYVTQGNTKK
jgi:hypothetical protein